MPNLKYAFAKLRTDFYLSGISDRYERGKSIPPPRYVIWDCTRRCNLRCAHCGASKEVYPEELTTDQVTGVLDQLAALEVDMFAITGGEPLLRKDLLDVLLHGQRCGLKTGIATNGFLLDEETAEQLKDAGAYSVQVSLDGLEPTHNEIRNHEQSFGRAVRAIELLLGQRVPLVSVATTVTPHNAPELPALRALLADLGVRMWRLAVVMPIGRAQRSDLALRGAELAALFEFVKRSSGKDLHVYLGENLTFLGDWERRIRSAPLICPIGFTACCIGVDGNVRGCPEQPDTAENREGSVLEQPFAQIWQDGFGRYRNREVFAIDETCNTCETRYDCYGGCWVMREEGNHCIYHLLA
jgi:radical SAM protein with 4Fe4S-binding SPASM domain